MRFRHHRFATLLWLLPLGCSSSHADSTVDAGTGCAAHPLSCGPAQTCWPVDVSHFACIDAGSGAEGASCSLIVGSATCGAGMGCFGFQGANGAISGPACVPYCDPSAMVYCAVGGQCGEATVLQNPDLTTQVCLDLNGDAGAPDATE